MSAKIIKLTDNNNNTLLPVTKADVVQYDNNGNYISVQEAITNNNTIQELTEYSYSTPLAVGDTHDEGFSKLSKIIEDNEYITAAAITYLNDNKKSKDIIVNVTTWEEYEEVLRGEKSENTRGRNVITHYESDKTFSEIHNAINDGYNVLLSFNDRVYNLSRADEKFISFVNNDIYGGDAHMTSFIINSLNGVIYSAHGDVSEGALARTSELDSFVIRPYGYDNQIVRMNGTGNIQSGNAILTDEGDIWAKKYIIQGSTIANATRLISSDAADNAYFSINGRTNLRVSYDAVAPDVSVARTINLGDNGKEWNNVYAKKFITWGGREDTFVRGDGVLQGIKTINGYSLMGSGNIELATSADSALSYTSYNPIQNSPVAYAIDNLNDTKQDLLVSGTNIKTINNNSLLGSGNINLAPAADSTLNYTSYNPIQNSPVAYAINNLNDTKQDLLVSGTNIKTVNSNSLVGEGDVQVGDITGVYLDETIEDLDESLMTYALRKTEQYLNPSEREQVLSNLGISGAVTSSNLKTINGTSLVGNGDFQVAIAYAGYINIAQSLGYSQEYIMSQNAVTEQVERLRPDDLSSLENMTGTKRLPNEYEELIYITNGPKGSGAIIDTGLLPNDNNWRFVGSWMRTDDPAVDWSSILSARTGNTSTNEYSILRSGNSKPNIAVMAGTVWSTRIGITLKNQNINVWHTFDLSYGQIIVDDDTYAITTTTGNTLTSNMLLGSVGYPVAFKEFMAYHNNVLVAHMIPCVYYNIVGMYDIVRNQFYSSTNSNNFVASNFKGTGSNKILSGDGLNYLIEQETGTGESKLMSQNAITDYGKRLSKRELELIFSGANYDLPEGYTELDYISNTNGAGELITNLIPTEKTWRFIGSWRRTNTPSSSTYYMFRSVTTNARSFSIHTGNFNYWAFRCYMSSSDFKGITVSNDLNVWHTVDLSHTKIIFDNVEYDNKINTNGSVTNTEQLRLFPSNTALHLDIGPFIALNNNVVKLCLIPCISSNNVVGMYDTISKTFYGESSTNIGFDAGNIMINTSNKLISAADLTDFVAHELGDSELKTLSQNVITTEIDRSKYDDKRPTYFAGGLTQYNFSEFPTLDPRACEGFSIIMCRRNWGNSLNCSLFRMVPSSFSDVNDILFRINERWSGIYAGLSKTYGTVLVSGSSTSLRYGAHWVITFNLKNGNLKAYVNGKLLRNVQPTESCPYDYNNVLSYLNAASHLTMGYGGSNGIDNVKVSGMALSGHIFTDDEVAEIYGDGCESTIYQTVPDKYKANNIVPYIFVGTDWSVVDSGTTSTFTRDENQNLLAVLNQDKTYMNFGFTNINGPLHNVKFDWEFTVVSGTAITNSAGISLRNGTSKCLTITDELGNDASYGVELVTGRRYHVTCKPNIYNIQRYGVTNSATINPNHLQYKFTSATSDFSILIDKTIIVQEIGAAVICDTNTYRKDYWELPGGLHIPMPKYEVYENMPKCEVHYDIYKDKCIKYSNDNNVQFNGQLALNSTNGKVYVGYLNTESGTWKQINNS